MAAAPAPWTIERKRSLDVCGLDKIVAALDRLGDAIKESRTLVCGHSTVFVKGLLRRVERLIDVVGRRFFELRECAAGAETTVGGIDRLACDHVLSRQHHVTLFTV